MEWLRIGVEAVATKNCNEMGPGTRALRLSQRVLRSQVAKVREAAASARDEMRAFDAQERSPSVAGERGAVRAAAAEVRASDTG